MQAEIWKWAKLVQAAKDAEDAKEEGKALLLFSSGLAPIQKQLVHSR